MRKPTIGIAVDSFLPRWDGVSRALIEFIPRLTPNFNFKLLVPGYPGERPSFDGTEYVLFPLLPWLRFEGAGVAIAHKAKMKTACNGIDLLWTHSVGTLGGKAMSEASARSLPIVSMIHSIEWEIYAENLPFLKSVFRNYWLKECRKRYRDATRIITPSQATADTLRAHGFSPPISVTPLGVDTARFQPLNATERAERKDALGIDKRHFVIGYLGRFGAEKNLELLARAFDQLDAPSTHLLMVGGDSGALKYRPDASRVTFVGSTTEPERYYQAMDAYVLPSRSESAPLAILEAMATGAIPLSTPVGNVPSYLHADVGYLFEQDSSPSLIGQLRQLLSDPGKHPQMRQRARELVVSKFDWNESAARLATIFSELL